MHFKKIKKADNKKKYPHARHEDSSLIDIFITGYHQKILE